MSEPLDKLLERSSAAIGRAIDGSEALPDYLEPIERLLRARNGFWAGYSALHVLPFDLRVEPSLHLNEALAKPVSRYQSLNKPIVFAFDACGMPFIFDTDRFAHLNYETGELVSMGTTLDEWAQKLVQDFSKFTAWPLVEAWQNKNGALPVGKRLFPTRPFIMGGQYDASNLNAVEILDGFGAASEIYLQTKDLPDGSKVRIVVAD